MTTVHHDARITDDERRDLVFHGDPFVYSPVQASMDLVDLPMQVHTSDPAWFRMNARVMRYDDITSQRGAMSVDSINTDGTMDGCLGCSDLQHYPSALSDG